MSVVSVLVFCLCLSDHHNSTVHSVCTVLFQRLSVPPVQSLPPRTSLNGLVAFELPACLPSTAGHTIGQCRVLPEHSHTAHTHKLSLSLTTVHWACPFIASGSQSPTTAPPRPPPPPPPPPPLKGILSHTHFFSLWHYRAWTSQWCPIARQQFVSVHFERLTHCATFRLFVWADVFCVAPHKS